MLKLTRSFVTASLMLVVAASTVNCEDSAVSATFFPRNTVLFVQADMSEAKRKLCAASAMGKIWNSHEMQDFLQKPRARLKQLLTSLDQISQFKTADFRACLQQQAGIGLILHNHEVSLLIAGKITDPAAAQRVRNNLPEFLQKNGLGGKPHPAGRRGG